MSKKSTSKLVSVLAVVSLVFAASAAAEGGSSIATAPVIPWGQQQFGSLAGGSKSPTASYCRSSGGNSDMPTRYWTLSGATGDHVTIDFEVGARSNVIVMPLGTTDFTLDQEPFFSDQTFINGSAGGKHQLAFVLNQGGQYPVLFCEYVSFATAYNFTANVKHSAVLSLRKRAKMPRKGTIDVSVRTPEGGIVSDAGVSITLQVKKPRATKWKSIGSAPAFNSVASISYRLASSLTGRKVSLRAVLASPSYVPSTSSAIRVKVK